MSSCRKIHDPYKFEEAFNLVSRGVSCERSVDLIALFHISNGLASFHISLKCTHVEQCKDHWTPLYEVMLPQFEKSGRKTFNKIKIKASPVCSIYENKEN